jgi:nucleotide-binding universal stress UspA family protein
VRLGPVVPQLLRAATDAAMLVVGSSGHGLAAGTVTGSVSQHAARHAACPVVVVRPPRSPHARRIVVGIDGSRESQRALRFACERAETTGENVVAVHGYHSMSLRWLTLDGGASAPLLRRMAEADRFVAEETAGFAIDFPGVEIATEAIAVRPAELLVTCSASASLVVVGSRGRDAFAEMLLGSVSQHLLHHAECPVCVVR